MRRTWRPTTPCGTLGGSLLSWRTKRQSTLPRDRLITFPEGDFPLFPHPIRRNVDISSSRTGHRNNQYVAFRKSMGDDFSSTESVLETFCRRVGEDTELADVTADHVQAFLIGTGTVSGYWRRKYDALRGLYRYAISRGFIDKAPLPSTAVRAPRFKPHIYTDDELRRLLDTIPSCLNPPRKLEPHTLRSILLLLYGAGLRIGEVVTLTVADVDISASVITVRNAKFHKTR